MNAYISLRKHLGLMVVVLLLVSCDSDDSGGDSSGNFDRKSMLTNIADNVIVPAYDSLSATTQTLLAQTQELNFGSSADKVENLRISWKHALKQWQYAALYDFGPASDQGLLSFFNLFPVSTTHIEDNIASGNYNLETAANIDAIGLQAMDYLLFGIESDAADLANYFSENPGYINYLIENATLMNNKATATLQGWTSGYRDSFVNATGTDIGSSLGQLVNVGIQYFEVHLRDAKIGIPAGARSSSGTPLPLQVEAYYNGAVSKEMLVNGIEGWQNMFNGNSRTGEQGSGLDDYLKFLGTTFNGNPLHEGINERMENAKTQTLNLSSDLREAVVNQQNECMDIFSELQQSVVLLKVDMTSAMGIQITYVDNDGD